MAAPSSSVTDMPNSSAISPPSSARSMAACDAWLTHKIPSASPPTR